MDLKYILNSPDVERIASSLEALADDATGAITGKVSRQQSVSDNGKALVIGPDGLVTVGGAVRYDIEQGLTNAQKATVRGSIGAADETAVPVASGIITSAVFASLAAIPQNTMYAFSGDVYAGFEDKPFDAQGFGVFVETLSPNKGSMTGGIQRVMSWSGSKATNKIAVRAYQNGAYRNWIVYDSISESDFSGAVDRITTLEDTTLGMDGVTIDASAATGVYADMNTFPKNSIIVVLSSGAARIANFPGDYHSAGTVVTLNGYTTNGGTAQIIYFFNGQTATRTCNDTATNTWTDWVYSGIVYRTFTVKASGGDFPNPAAALKNVMDSGRANEHYRYIIDIDAGTFDMTGVVSYIASGMNRRGLYVMPYTTIKGKGKDKTKLKFYYTGDDEQIKEYVSGLNAPYTCWIEDLTLSVSEIRYAIHSDNATEATGDESTLTNALLNDNVITLKNVRLEHLGFANYAQDVADEKYRAPAAWGGGTWNATDRVFINCDFYAAQYSAWLNHDRVGITRPSNFTFDHCAFTALNTGYDGLARLAIYGSCSLISWGSGVKTHVALKGCTANKNVALTVVTEQGNARAVVDYDVRADNDIYIIESTTNDSHLARNWVNGCCMESSASAAIAAYAPVTKNSLFRVTNYDRSLGALHGIALESAAQNAPCLIQVRGLVSLVMLGATGFALGDMIGWNGSAWVVDAENPLLKVIDNGLTGMFI